MKTLPFSIKRLLLALIGFSLFGCTAENAGGYWPNMSEFTWGTASPSTTMPGGSVVIFPFATTFNDPNNPLQFVSNSNEVTITQIASDEIAVQIAENFTGTASVTAGQVDGSGAFQAWGQNLQATMGITVIAPVGTVSLAASQTSAAITDTVTLTPTTTGITSPTYTFSVVEFTPGTSASPSGETQVPGSDLPVTVVGGSTTATVTSTAAGVATVQALAVSSDSTEQSSAQIQITFHD